MANLPCDYCNSSDGVQAYQDGMFCFVCHRKQFIGERRKALGSSPTPDEVQYPTARNKTVHPGTKIITNVKQCQYLECLPFRVDVRPRLWESVELYSNNKQKWYTIHDCIEWEIHDLKGEYVGSEYRLFSGGRKSISDYPSGTVFFSKPYDKGSIRVITEDIASAIKVSTVCPSLALLGTSLPRRVSRKLLDILASADKFILWLDGDKPGQEAAKKIYKTISQFKPVCNIVTSKDPKHYETVEIQEILREYVVDNLGGNC